MNLVYLLEKNAKKYSRRKCLIADNATYDFRSLNKKVNQLSWGLREKLRMKKGDRVAILMNNCPEFIISLFAVLKAQGVCVPLNVFLAANELKYILKDSGSRFLIASSDFLEILRKFILEKEKGNGDLSNLENIILTNKKEDNFLYWNEILGREKTKNLSLDIDPEDLAFLIYTSGTTGFPKGVMLSHRNLYSNVLSSVWALEFRPQERFLLLLPMFHSFTLTVCILVPIYAGARIIIIKSVRPFQRVLRSILLNRVTIVVGIPHLFDILQGLKLPAIFRLFLRVKICISGAAPLSIETLKRFKERFKGISLLEGYGLTEASPVVSLNPLHGIQKPGSIGLPLPGIEVRIVREDESEAAVGEIGELIVRGANVMKGYLNLPEETEKAVRGGWLFTGDMAKIDNDGYIYIVGRKKEMILVRGMNVYPSEIENAMRTHPKVKEIAVVGREDKIRGEAPVAFVVLHKNCSATEGEIIHYCKGKLANYKIPRIIEFREDLPKTPTGKILKRKLV